MGMFSYEAINKSGEIVNGKLEADEESAVVQRLREMDLAVVDVKEERTSPVMELFRGRKKKVSLADLSLASRQMAAMLDAGIPVTRVLYTISRQVTNPTLGEALKEIAGNVEGGMNLTEALRGHPQIFSKLYVGMVQSGETGGTLQEALQSISLQLQKDKSLRDNMRSATFYPMVVMVFAFLLLLAMMFFLVPIFMGFFPPDVELPLITQLIINISESLQNFWYLWFLAGAGIVFGLRYYVRSEGGSRNWDRVKFRIPAVGSLIHKAVIARFARTFSTLIAGGIPVIQALESAGEATGSTVVEEAINETTEQIQEGKSIAAPMEKIDVFPPMMVHMISVGEETGALPDLLTRIAEFFEEEVEVMSKGLSSMIEPLLLIFVGVVVGIMLISLYLPMFTVITQV